MKLITDSCCDLINEVYFEHVVINLKTNLGTPVSHFWIHLTEIQSA
jgi:hypothetical protein